MFNSKKRQDLFYLKYLFNKHKILFRLGYGTLLGAVRQNDFIKGDSDVDLLFDYVDKTKVYSLLPLIQKKGFVIQYDRKNVLGLNSNGTLFDFYFFKQNTLLDKLFDRVTCGYGFYCVEIDKLYWDESTTIKFLGKDFCVFKDYEMWLTHVYGSDWRVPQSKKGKAKTWTSRFCMFWLRWVEKNTPKSIVLFVKKVYRRLFK